MAALSSSSDPRLRTRNAIPTRGSPDHAGSGARPGARTGGCRLQQFQFTVQFVSFAVRPGVVGCPGVVGARAVFVVLERLSATAQITANWEKFFNAGTPTSQRVALLQNGSTFSSAIADFSKMPLASGIGAKVTSVTVNSATSATVTYAIVSGSTTLLGGQTGKAVYQDGTWKVGDASLCGLFKLVPGGTLPAACSSAG